MSLLIKTENNYHANLNETDINNKQTIKPLFSSKIKSPWKIILVEPIKKMLITMVILKMKPLMIR